MIYLLYLATGYLVVISLILLRNRLNFTSLSAAKADGFTDDAPKVSICIPARNEERDIRCCVTSALDQAYPNLEVLVLNDGSTDRTGEILQDVKQQHPGARRLVLLKGRPKPDHWLGKPWACQQLGEAASGSILIFADADTWLESQTAGRVVRTMGRDVVDMLTVWPRQVLGSFWEKMLIPLVYYALFSLLPVRYVYRAPRWMPPFLRKRTAPLFAAACGQFMAFKEQAYRKIGGHEAVRDRVVDDVALARTVKKAGLPMRMYYGGQAVGCRMYRTENEIRQGFRKNFLPGFNRNLGLFLLAGLLHAAAYLLPPLMLPLGLYTGSFDLIAWSALPILLMLVHRLMIARWFGWNPLWGLLHPVGVLWFQWLAILSIRDYLTDTPPEWKGRQV